ncbi:MAG: thiamine pyrophosphate-dependent enzyme [Gemmatimonadaceae bacterium]
MIDLVDALNAVRRVRRAEDVVITTMAASRAWMEGGTQPLDFTFVPSCMGHATSLGLGLALAQPRRRVIVCNGDGSMLMNLGSLVTITAQSPPNLVVIVLDNGVYEVTGAQPTPGSAAGRSLGQPVDFATIARGAGFESVFHSISAEQWARDADRMLSADGPVFIWLAVRPVSGKAGPRSPGPAAERARGFMQALSTARPEAT